MTDYLKKVNQIRKNVIEDLIDMRVFDPYESRQVDFQELVKEWICDPKAGYMRV